MLGRLLLGCGMALCLAPLASAQDSGPLELVPGPVELPAPVPPGMPQPLQFATAVAVDYGLAEFGRWEQTAAAAVWRLRLRSPGANSMNARLIGLQLPDGAELRVSDPQRTLVHGPYGPGDSLRGELWTPVVPGDTLALELRVPAAMRPAVALTVAQIGHGYLEFWKAGERAKSGQCNVDVACPAGDAWQDEIRAVARYTVDGKYLCSGTLLNNALEDFSPYFLTASHCVSTPESGLSMVLYWNFESSRCGGEPDGRLDQTQSGALLLDTSTIQAGDFALLRLLAPPSPAFDVYYSGWDARDAAPDGVAAIHHPAGDEKRISLEYDPLSITSLYESEDFGDGNFLRVTDWDLGTTEPGSSGAGIWDFEHRLVGTLTGGAAACGNSASDWLGRFHRHWDDGVSLHLDPLGISGGVMDGADPAQNLQLPALDLQPLEGGGAGWPPGLLLAGLLRRRYSRR